MESSNSSSQSIHLSELDSVRLLLSNGEEPRQILAEVVSVACRLPSVKSATIILFRDADEDKAEIIASIGEMPPTDRYDITVDAALHGQLAIYREESDIKHLDSVMVELCFLSSLAIERLRSAENIQHYMDRVQVLHELNQLIATNVPLERVVKSIAREGAFRFSTDLCAVYVLDNNTQILTPSGCYGADKNGLPTFLENDTGIMGQALRTGGLISIPRINQTIAEQLKFVTPLNISTIHLCPLEVRGDPLGVLVAGFTDEIIFTDKERTRLEEFAQAAAVAVANAITQEQIKSYSERLEELVQSRTQDLAIQTQRAESANNAKSQFLANMSHELRTPLTAIVGYASVISDGLFGEINERQKEGMDAITRSSDHLKNLIDDVLNLARIESGKEAPEPKAVSLSELLQQSYKLILQNALLKGLTVQPITLSADIQAAMLWSDPKHIQQVMINLLSNAVKYTPSGGKVWVTVERISDKIKISVNDTGVGIPESKITTLFERFERGDDEYSKSQEGTGIGLNLTKRLVELNGGMIGATSEFGKGSCFWIMIPSASQSTEDKKKLNVEETAKIRLDGLTVMVVDDNKDTCEVVQMILQAAGAKASINRSIKDGLATLENEIPDIVITDLALLGESGIDLIKELKSNPKTSNIPCIVMSACAFPQDQQAAFEAGADSFIAKPFKPIDVVSEVRRVTVNAAMKGT
jgi:signal transduction histidine kinase/ActR/RegA family two-component response regulator